MNVKSLLEQLSKDGLTVEVLGDHLRVTPTLAIKPEHKDVLRANKEAIHAYLRSEISKAETKETTSPQSTPCPQPADQDEAYKRYSMPCGSALELTREEFDAVVDLFRQLAAADVKLGPESPCGRCVSDEGEANGRAG